MPPEQKPWRRSPPVRVRSAAPQIAGHWLWIDHLEPGRRRRMVCL